MNEASTSIPPVAEVTSELPVDDGTLPKSSGSVGSNSSSKKARKPIEFDYGAENMENWRRNLTGSQRQMLARAWDKNGTPPAQAGWKIFLNIFASTPEVLHQFNVTATTTEQLGYDETFVRHTEVFGEALSFVVKRLPNDHTMTTVVIPFLRELGARHSKFKKKGFKLTYWDVFAEAMAEAFSHWDLVTHDKTQRAKDRARAWRSLVFLIVEEVRIGWEIALTGGDAKLSSSHTFLNDVGVRRADRALEMGRQILTREYDPLGPIEFIKRKDSQRKQSSEERSPGSSVYYPAGDELSPESVSTSTSYATAPMSHTPAVDVAAAADGATRRRRVRARHSASPLPRVQSGDRRRQPPPPPPPPVGVSRPTRQMTNSDSGWSSQSRERPTNGHRASSPPPAYEPTRRSQSVGHALSRRLQDTHVEENHTVQWYSTLV